MLSIILCLFLGNPTLSSISDLGPKGKSSQTSVTEMQTPHDNNLYGPSSRAALPSITIEQPVSNYSGEWTVNQGDILKISHGVVPHSPCSHSLLDSLQETQSRPSIPSQPAGRATRTISSLPRPPPTTVPLGCPILQNRKMFRISGQTLYDILIH